MRALTLIAALVYLLVLVELSPAFVLVSRDNSSAEKPTGSNRTILGRTELVWSEKPTWKRILGEARPVAEFIRSPQRDQYLARVESIIKYESPLKLTEDDVLNLIKDFREYYPEKNLSMAVNLTERYHLTRKPNSTEIMRALDFQENLLLITGRVRPKNTCSISSCPLTMVQLAVAEFGDDGGMKIEFIPIPEEEPDKRDMWLLELHDKTAIGLTWTEYRNVKSLQSCKEILTVQHSMDQAQYDSQKLVCRLVFNPKLNINDMPSQKLATRDLSRYYFGHRYPDQGKAGQKTSMLKCDAVYQSDGRFFCMNYPQAEGSTLLLKVLSQ